MLVVLLTFHSHDRVAAGWPRGTKCRSAYIVWMWQGSEQIFIRSLMLNSDSVLTWHRWNTNLPNTDHDMDPTQFDMDLT